MFASACDLSISWAGVTQSMPSHLSFRPHFNMTHLCLGLTSGLCHSGMPTKTLPYMCHMPCPFRHPLFARSNIWWGVHIMKLFVMQFSPVLCYLLPLRHRHPSSRHILKSVWAVVTFAFDHRGTSIHWKWCMVASKWDCKKKMVLSVRRWTTRHSALSHPCALSW